MIHRIALTFLLGSALALPAAAQGKDGRDRIPKGFRPPPGMCRIWLDNVPPGQQPAPTDCVTAVRNRPPNGRVIFGDDLAEPRRFRGPATPAPPGDDREVADDERRAERRAERREDRGDDAPRPDDARRGTSDDETRKRADAARKRRRPDG